MISSPSRRQFLGMGATGLVLATGLRPARVAATTALASAPPFTLGVASGDPTHDSVVLWTRLANDPLDGGGMPSVPIPVHWELATDPDLRHVIRRGTAIAWPIAAHTVHVHVDDLAPDRWYWYRFRAGREQSPIGRTRTFPAPWSAPREMKFAFVSCQNFEAGFYTAYANLAEEDLDFVVHLGDYIYEDGPSAGGPRQHIGDEPMSLDDYRTRHAQYRSDAHLQAAHASFPFIVTWDDHEVENNYAGLISEDNDVPAPPPCHQRPSASDGRTRTAPISSTCRWARAPFCWARARACSAASASAAWPRSTCSTRDSFARTSRAAARSISCRRPGTTSRSHVDRRETRGQR